MRGLIQEVANKRDILQLWGLIYDTVDTSISRPCFLSYRSIANTVSSISAFD